MGDKKFNEIKAINNYVCLRVERIKESDGWKEKNKILVPNKPSEVDPQNERFRVNLYIHNIGDLVENPQFKIGDKVVANNYDMQFVSDSDEDDENVYVLIKADQIKAVLS